MSKLTNRDPGRTTRYTKHGLLLALALPLVLAACDRKTDAPPGSTGGATSTTTPSPTPAPTTTTTDPSMSSSPASAASRP